IAFCGFVVSVRRFCVLGTFNPSLNEDRAYAPWSRRVMTTSGVGLVVGQRRSGLRPRFGGEYAPSVPRAHARWSREAASSAHALAVVRVVNNRRQGRTT